MKSFFKFLVKSFFFLCATVGFFVLLIIGAAIFYASSEIDYFINTEIKSETTLSDHMLLELNLNNGITEKSTDYGFTWDEEALDIKLIAPTLNMAAKDSNIGGLIIHIGQLDMGLAEIQEIRDAVLEFRKSGKPTVAFTESFGEESNGTFQYYLASAFETIFMQPSGTVELMGLRLESPYAKNLLDKLGIEAQMARRENYKGAVEMFTQTSMSKSVQSNMQNLTDSILHQIAEDIAKERGFNLETTIKYIDDSPYLGLEAVKLKLIDHLYYFDEALAKTKEMTSSPEAEWEIITIKDYSKNLPDPSDDAPSVAVIYGLGEIVLDNNTDSPFNGHSMSSGTIVNAFQEAIEDESIKAIIFRVDSPGGSYTASDTIWRQIKLAEDQGKPVIVSMGNFAASGGYFISAPASLIVASPFTITGSIGIYGGKFVTKNLWDKLGINWDSIQSGKNAHINSTNLGYDKTGWDKLQNSLDAFYNDFLEKVAEGRDLPIDQVRQIAGGRVWTGIDAKENGLVDELGGFTKALNVTKQELELSEEDEIQLVEFPKTDPFDSFLSLLKENISLEHIQWLKSLQFLDKILSILDTNATNSKLLMHPITIKNTPN
ncbi:MAG: signal peptide peptidase SppA [Alphaproteobacteria bacterium]|nr:signal peptide peptidase SppA [Alphaproteobacteria bacterium]